jgi:hypothetical protein
MAGRTVTIHGAHRIEGRVRSTTAADGEFCGWPQARTYLGCCRPLPALPAPAPHPCPVGAGVLCAGSGPLSRTSSWLQSAPGGFALRGLGTGAQGLRQCRGPRAWPPPSGAALTRVAPPRFKSALFRPRRICSRAFDVCARWPTCSGRRRPRSRCGTSSNRARGPTTKRVRRTTYWRSRTQPGLVSVADERAPCRQSVRGVARRVSQGAVR